MFFYCRLDFAYIGRIVHAPQDCSETSVRLRLIRIKLSAFFGKSLYYCFIFVCCLGLNFNLVVGKYFELKVISCHSNQQFFEWLYILNY